jgi:hypothetical protein
MATNKRTSEEDDFSPGDLGDRVRVSRDTVGSGQLDLRDLLRMFAGEPINDNTTNRDLLDTDDGNYFRFTNASAKTCTLLEESSDGYNDRFTVQVHNVGAGNLTIVGESTNVMINSPAGGSHVLSTGMTATIKRVGLNEFDVFGQTAP